MSIRIVCSNCRKRYLIAVSVCRNKAVCRKCGTSLARGPVHATELEPTREAAVRGSHTSTARWNKWSLAQAREHWIGRRMQRETERERERAVDRKRRGRPKVVRRNRRQPQVAGSRCRACDDGKMRARTVYRWGRWPATIGYVLLTPAILGLIVNLAILATATFGLSHAVSDVSGIPVQMVELVMRVEEISDRQAALMTAEQQQAVRTTRLVTTGATLGRMGSRDGTVGYALVGWFLVALSGLVLSRKKHVLRCTTCETVLSNP